MMAAVSTSPEAARTRLAITALGVVQGVGFRPFVERIALRCGLGGWVRNAGGAVQIEVEGGAEDVAAFVRALAEERPHAAIVRAMHTEARAPLGTGRFSIEASAPQSRPAPSRPDAAPAREAEEAQVDAASPIPPDIAPCARCLAELSPPHRRAGHAFTSCTECGPRYTVALGVPYDRARTTMAGFALCDACRTEYEDPADHRAHAQTLSCAACGPRLFVCEQGGTIGAEGSAAIVQAVNALRAGKIVAMKGVGGYQLLCDARDEKVVAALRRRKHREDRPFAVLFESMSELDMACDPTPEERAQLTSPAAPIVLCATRPGADLAPSVARGSPLTGAMLPASPLHHLVARAFGGPLVCTSGNVTGHPLCIDDGEAADRLGFIADVLLAHDRPIARACDDSVVRVTALGLQVIRRARGLAPLPVARPEGGPSVLAVGGHIKSAVAIAAGRHAVLSQHIGDLDDAGTVARFRATIDDLLAFVRVRPEIVACDLHPDYTSTRIAESIARAFGAPLARVQHHHAHVAAVMAERGLTGPVLGLAWDGIGDGGDGTAWGGEALVCDGPTFSRLAHLRTFALPGGDRAAREPRRSAAGVLAEIREISRAPSTNDKERHAFAGMIARAMNAPRTSSMGRLFDAVAALVGLRYKSTFEGQAAMELENAARGDLLSDPYPFEVKGEAAPFVVDWEPLVRALLRDVDQGALPAEISRRFHATLAEVAAALAKRSGLGRVVLGGGCFQNARLVAAVKERLTADGFEVFGAGLIPPNDGGLALGQAHVVTARALAGMRLDHDPCMSGKEKME
jgi:hydrogenase maturation protein HypF